MLFVLPGYRQFPFRISPLAIAVGVVGVVLWIWHLQPAPRTEAPRPARPRLASSASATAPPTTRSKQLTATPTWAYTFLAIRFLGLALVVPIIEEFFLRGFLMRFVAGRQLVESALRQRDAARRRRRHRRPDADAPRRTAGRLRLVQPRHLADGPHQKHLGLRRRPRRDESAARASTSSPSTSGNSGKEFALPR